MTIPRNTILLGDARDQMQRLPAQSVDMFLTSPPYFRLRNYGMAGQLGLEPHVDDWVAQVRLVAREAARVLMRTGSLWLNLADTYATHQRQGAARKSLLLGPERLIAALVADGWILRNKIVWAKPNPMPTSVRDRLTCSYELLYVLVRQPHYYFDLDAVRVPHRTTAAPTTSADTSTSAWRGPNSPTVGGLVDLKRRGIAGHPLGKNPGDVWTIAPSRYRSAHHATFPLALATRAIAAACPERRCSTCRLPWQRATTRSLGAVAVRGDLTPTCGCNTAAEPGLVLDPFFGAGTTAVAAHQLQRDWLGIELNPAFAAVASDRLASAGGNPEPSSPTGPGRRARSP